MTLGAVTRVLLPRDALVDTETALRTFGRAHSEGLVLWIGQVQDTTAVIECALVPPQLPIQDEDGVGYFVDARTLFQISRLLEQRRSRLIAQVHSHPGRAYHSETDDRYAVVTTEGGFSLVVPDFARAPMTLGGCAIYRLSSDGWRPMTDEAVETTFELVPSGPPHSSR